jgi:Tol biopolymer transport system component
VLTNSKSLRIIATIAATLMVAVVALPAQADAKAKTILISKSSSGAHGNGDSSEPSSSYYGSVSAFSSHAGNLVAGDTNGVEDCFVRVQSGGSTERVSVSSSETQANGRCYGPAISGSGRFVAFDSLASNLVGGDTNGSEDVFVRDRTNGTTERVSVSTGGGQGNALSIDPAISGDGRYVVFESLASNLVPGDTNARWDVFVHDRHMNTTTRVSVRSNGQQGNGGSRDAAISANGRYVVFHSSASNLVKGDTNGKRDVFIHDRATGKTKRVSVNSREKQGNGPSDNAVVSADGRFVAFQSRARNLVKGDTNGSMDVFLRDRKKGTTKRISLNSKERQANGWSGDPSISRNGRFIAFESTAANLVGKDTNKKRDVFLRNRKKGTTIIISKTSSGGQAFGGDSDDPSISGDGRYVAFESEARNMVKNDRDGDEDIFRRGPLR